MSKDKDQYPKDYNPPHTGSCKLCGYKTKGWTKVWLGLCPTHWQALLETL